jgi:DNA repair ATPase RecN
VDVVLNAKALQLLFGGANNGSSGTLFFHQLSDGEKALIALYMVQAALESGAVQTVMIDEPDNYVGLPELQPWVLSLREILNERHQAILISHHPEILSSAGEDHGRYLWRDNHTSPTRIGPLSIPEGLSPGEAIARGWVRG